MPSTGMDPLAATILADYGLALTLARRILSDGDGAREAVQESVYRALLHQKSFDRARPVRPWFLRIVRNVALNERKRRSKFVEMPDLEGDASPLVAALRAEQSATLREIVADLPKTYRAVVHLRYDCGYQYKEISRALCIPIGTTKTVLHRAHKVMRRALLRGAA